MIHSIHLLSVFPGRFVSHTDTARAAQITIRLLVERHPGMTFGFDEGPDCRHGDCHPSIKDSALSAEVRRLVAAEIALEAKANPQGLQKWCAFQYRNGGVVAHPEHDLRAVEMCRRDLDVVQERPIFSHHPTPAEVLDRFRGEADTAA